MTNTKERRPGPVEVWLTKANIAITCQVVREDESVGSYGVESLSMRGAQREMTGWMIDHGYETAGRWETAEGTDDGASETVRKFKPTSEAQVL
jgi:hypothetical protein